MAVEDHEEILTAVTIEVGEHVLRDRIPAAHVDRARYQGAQRGIGERLEIFHLVGITHISLDESGLAFFALDRFDRLFTCGIDITDDNLGAVPGEQHGRGPSDPAASAGNQDDLVREIESLVHDASPVFLRTPKEAVNFARTDSGRSYLSWSGCDPESR